MVSTVQQLNVPDDPMKEIKEIKAVNEEFQKTSDSTKDSNTSKLEGKT